MYFCTCTQCIHVFETLNNWCSISRKIFLNSNHTPIIASDLVSCGYSYLSAHTYNMHALHSSRQTCMTPLYVYESVGIGFRVYRFRFMCQLLLFVLPTKHPSSHSRMSNISFLTSLPRESLTWISCDRHSISHVEGHASRVRHEVVQLQKPKVSCKKARPPSKLVPGRRKVAHKRLRIDL